MISKEQFSDSIVKEAKILKHLFGKILPGTLDYKPTEKQRTTRELLQYMGRAFAMQANGIKSGSMGDLAAALKASAGDDVANFPARMDELAALVPTVVLPMTDDELAAEVDLFGRGPQSRSQWFLEMMLKNMVAYKMQLFLYIKASGNDTIGTSDLSRGEDSKPAA